MPEGLAAALALPGLWLLMAVTLASGVVYGFAGFGSALIVMPVAASLVEPEVAVAAFAISALASFVTLVPRAWALADRRDTLMMVGAALSTMPAGIWLLTHADERAIRWAVSALVAATLAALVLGWRLRPGPSLRLKAGVGAASGVLGGATGLMGPLVILFHLGSASGAAATRANTTCFLTFVSLAILPVMALQGALGAAALWLGLAMLLPYGLGTRLGAALFRPGREGLYRGVAHAVIAAAVIAGLPVWG